MGSYLHGASVRTYVAKPADVLATRRWWVVDAKDQPLGRLASAIAVVLRGKHKPVYTPHVDTGDFVIVVNASRVKVTGTKAEGKKYYRHSGYPGGIKEISFRNLVSKSPETLIRLAVRGMLPKNPLGRKMIGKLKVYAGEQHPHQAQKPEPLTLELMAGR